MCFTSHSVVFVFLITGIKGEGETSDKPCPISWIQTQVMNFKNSVLLHLKLIQNLFSSTRPAKLPVRYTIIFLKHMKLLTANWDEKYFIRHQIHRLNLRFHVNKQASSYSLRDHKNWTYFQVLKVEKQETRSMDKELMNGGVCAQRCQVLC